MASVNKVVLLGNIGRAPELRHTPTGGAVCSVSLATSRTWKSKETGERQEETEWHRVVFYDRLAEVAGEYLKKGRQIYVEGRLKTRKWTDKDGVEKYTTEIIGEQLQLLGSPAGDKPDSDDAQSASRAGAARPPEGSAQASRPPANRPGSAADNRYAAAKEGRTVPPAKTGTGFDDMENELF